MVHAEPEQQQQLQRVVNKIDQTSNYRCFLIIGEWQP